VLRRRIVRAGVLLAFVLLAAATHAQVPVSSTPVSVIAFDGGWNVPLWAAQRQGFFAANGIALQLAYTPNSVFLVDSLLDGRNDIGFALIDNLVAYREGQGETSPTGKPDLVAFMGADGGFLSVVAAPAVKTFADLKGKAVSVDAMTTGAAFVLRELLARNGVAESEVTYERAGATANRYRDLVGGKHGATLLRTPFELLAQSRGFNILATAEMLGPYQGTAGIVRRDWARDHDSALVAFLRAYRAGLEFVYDPANRGIVEALLVANIRDMTPTLAHQSYDLLLVKKGGLTRDLALDPAGIGTVLALRSKYGTPRKALTDAAPYVDSTYLRKAFGP